MDTREERWQEQLVSEPSRNIRIYDRPKKLFCCCKTNSLAAASEPVTLCVHVCAAGLDYVLKDIVYQGKRVKLQLWQVLY